MALLPISPYSQLENTLVRHVKRNVRDDFGNTLNFFMIVDYTGHWFHRGELFNTTLIGIKRKKNRIWGAMMVKKQIGF